jgi:undecaprenyl-diphosphatase
MAGEEKTAGAAPGGLEMLDRRATLFLYSRFRNPVFDALMPILSVGANKGIVYIAAGIAMMALGSAHVKAAGLVMLAGAGAAGVIAEMTVKMFWKRKRPFMTMPEITPKVPHRRLVKRPSFPSGHSAGYFAAALSLAVFFPSMAAPLAIAAALGAYSRIYNGVHYLSDVVVGSIVGIAFSGLMVWLLAERAVGLFS